MLTHRQRELLLFIHERLKESGIAPSFEEMKDAIHLRSKSGVHRLIGALIERGFLLQLPNRARALRVLKLPDAGGPTEMPENPNTTQISIMGRIAAGTPIEALQDEIDQITVPATMLRSGNHYALEIRGNSMINAGILEGDTAIIQACNTADSGEIVVALTQEHEATLKRFRKRGNMIALEAANPNYETRLLPETQVHIQGKLVGIIRHY